MQCWDYYGCITCCLFMRSKEMAGWPAGWVPAGRVWLLVLAGWVVVCAHRHHPDLQVREKGVETSHGFFQECLHVHGRAKYRIQWNTILYSVPLWVVVSALFVLLCTMYVF